MTVQACPKCGANEIGKGKQNSYANMFPVGKMSLGSEIEHLLCTNCGYIIESYVKSPRKFKGTMKA